MWLNYWTEIEENHVQSPTLSQALCDLRLFLLYLNSRAGMLFSIPSGTGHLKQGDWHISSSSGPVCGTGGKDQGKRHIPSLRIKSILGFGG